MATPPAALGVDLLLELTGARGRVAVQDSLRAAIRAGRLAAGARLPSSRNLAAELGLARNTVAEAYHQLVTEGWLAARQGSGTRVARLRVPAPVRPPEAPGSVSTCPRAGRTWPGSPGGPGCGPPGRP